MLEAERRGIICALVFSLPSISLRCKTRPEKYISQGVRTAAKNSNLLIHLCSPSSIKSPHFSPVSNKAEPGQQHVFAPNARRPPSRTNPPDHHPLPLRQHNQAQPDVTFLPQPHSQHTQSNASRSPPPRRKRGLGAKIAVDRKSTRLNSSHWE